MPNRRHFFRTVAGAAAGAFIAGRAPTLRAQDGRRQVSIGGRRIRVIDVHAHCEIPELVGVVKGTPLAEEADRESGLDGRLRDLDRQGVDIQALSINGYWWYAAERSLARDIVRVQNEGLAKIVAGNPDRYVALASVALQFPDLAAEQLEDGIKRLGLRGASIGGHMRGEDLSLPKYDMFWAKAAQLGALVFMHPGGAENIVKEVAFRGRGGLGNIMGNPLETSYFLSRLIFDGVFDRHPGLRVCGAHGGGYLPSYFGRTDVACEVRDNANCANTRRPKEYLRQNILADTMVLSDEGLRHLVAEMGVSQIVYRTDNPFNWPVTVDLVLNATFLNNEQKEAILGGNALRLLKIT
jgi:aminocarboxymuconate-semialdehyde decarboxylase